MRSLGADCASPALDKGCAMRCSTDGVLSGTSVMRAAEIQRAHGVVVSHPLRMRKALGSNPSVSIILVGAGCLRPPMAGGNARPPAGAPSSPCRARPSAQNCRVIVRRVKILACCRPFKYSATLGAAPAAPVESNAPDPVAMHYAASRRTASLLVKTRSMTRARTKPTKQRGASIAHPVLRANAILHPS